MLNGDIHGKWLSKNINSDTIIISNYRNGKLDGEFLQFHENGRIKLKAYFQKGQGEGEWVFYNEKGRVIKKGKYENGIPTGVWEIFNKKGRKLLIAYDFDLQRYTKNDFDPYYSSKAILQDDLNDEYIIAYFPALSVRESSHPLGGFISASEFFNDYMNIPRQFFNTFFAVNLTAKVSIEDNRLYKQELRYDKKEVANLDGFRPAFPYYVDTNDLRKITRVSYSENSLWLLQNRIEQLLLISGPWLMDASEDKVDLQIQIPIVLNSLRKY